MVVSQRDSIEFVVNESAFICLKEKQKHVEILFNVTVTASDSSQGELKWVKVNGDEKLRMKAKVGYLFRTLFSQQLFYLWCFVVSLPVRNT